MKLAHVIAPAAVQAAATKPLRSRDKTTFNAERGAADAVPLAKQLISLSIEFGNAVDFFGDVGKPNLFSKQLLQNVVDRSGSPTILRIGGNTQDRAEFCETCPDTLVSVVLNDPTDPKGTEAVEVVFNANLFGVLAENVPAGSPIIFGLNYHSLDLARAEIRAAVENLDQSLIMAYELGNEVNLYDSYRPDDYDVEDYATDMREWIPELASLAPGSEPKFQFPSFAGPELFKEDMTIANLVEMGVPQSIPEIEYLAVHGYPWNICNEESAALVDIRKLLNHSETEGLLNQYSGEIAAATSLGKEMHMGETGSVACHGEDGVSNTLGAALWELDYAFSGSVAGINRFFFHMGKGDFYYSMWEPLPSPKSATAHINPTYYTMLFVADLVAGLESPRIAPITGLVDSSVVHFAIYDGDVLEKLVLLNLEYFDSTSGSERGSLQFDVGSVLGPSLGIRRLTGAHSAATSGVTWAGQSVDNDGKIIGDLDIERVFGGVVTLLASEAVIIEQI